MSATDKVRVLIADDHPVLRLGIRQILQRSKDIDVVGEACNGKEAVDKTKLLKPDVLVLDIQMPVMDGLQVMDALLKDGAKVCILVLSAYFDEYFISETIARGAWGYYLKEDAPGMIVEAVRQAAMGKGKGRSPHLANQGFTYL